MHSSSVNLEGEVQKVTNLLIKVSNKCLRKVKTKKKKSKNHEYFDPDCYNKREELQRLANLLEKNPDNLTIRQSYHQTKRPYKSMIKSKKREHKELKLKLIASLKPNETKRKWEIIESVADSTFEDHPAEEIIHIDRWKTYFEKLGRNGEEGKQIL